jgi:hypothetical protein
MAGIGLTPANDLIGHKTTPMTVWFSHLTAVHCKGAMDQIVTLKFPSESISYRNGYQTRLPAERDPREFIEVV